MGPRFGSAEFSDAVAVAALGDLASMGPRFGSAEFVAAAGAEIWMVGLQWGRASWGRDSREARFAMTSLNELQWGGASGARNSGKFRDSVSGSGEASMGPRFGSAEIASRRRPGTWGFTGFNGAALRERGIR